VLLPLQDFGATSTAGGCLSAGKREDERWVRTEREVGSVFGDEEGRTENEERRRNKEEARMKRKENKSASETKGKDRKEHKCKGVATNAMEIG